jgi:hypothetical protein
MPMSTKKYILWKKLLFPERSEKFAGVDCPSTHPASQQKIKRAVNFSQIKKLVCDIFFCECLFITF